MWEQYINKIYKELTMIFKNIKSGDINNIIIDYIFTDIMVSTTSEYNKNNDKYTRLVTDIEFKYLKSDKWDYQFLNDIIYWDLTVIRVSIIDSKENSRDLFT